jgi:hypothetical protein
MKKILLQIANYRDQRQQIFETYCVPNTKKYAKKYDYEYVFLDGKALFRNPSWHKFYYLKNEILNNNLKDGDKILFIDADTYIVKHDEDYPWTKNFNYSIDNGNSHCFGIWSMVICDWTKNLIDDLLDENLYNQCKHIEWWMTFSDQAAWYSLAGIQKHSDTSFFDIADYGWNKTQETDLKHLQKYSLKELYENVCILDPTWNTTLLEEEDIPDYLRRYNIVKSKKEDTKIRHFAGGQNWNIYQYFNQQ